MAAVLSCSEWGGERWEITVISKGSGVGLNTWLHRMRGTGEEQTFLWAVVGNKALGGMSPEH